jgi:hypothetical protein
MPPLPPWEVIRDQLLYLMAPSLLGSLIVLVVVFRWRWTRPGAVPLAILAGLALSNIFEPRFDWWSRDPSWYSLFPATALCLIVGAVTMMVSALFAHPVLAHPVFAHPVTPESPVSPAATGSIPSPGNRPSERWWMVVIEFGLNACAILAAGWWLAPVGLSWGQAAISQPVAGALLGGVMLTLAALLAIVWNAAAGRFAHLLLGVSWGSAVCVVLIHAHSLRFTELAIALSCALVGTGIGLYLMTRLVPGTCALPHSGSTSIFAGVKNLGNWSGPAVFFPALSLGAATNTVSDLPVATFALIGLAPAGLALFLIRLLWPQCSHRRMIWVTLVLAIPGAVAVAIAVSTESIGVG